MSSSMRVRGGAEVEARHGRDDGLQQDVVLGARGDAFGIVEEGLGRLVVG